MTHIVFLTQVIDPDDPTLGFVTSWIDALAARVDGVTAVGNEVRGVSSLAPNVRLVSLGKERGAGRASRAVALQRAVATSGGPRCAVLAHMCPIYLNIAAPVTAARRIPTMLWFAHPSVTPALRVAERLTDVVLTSLPGAYPRPSSKVRIVGQATDTDRIAFRPRSAFSGRPVRLVAIGRTSPSKGFDRAIRALAKARAEGVDAALRIVGPSTNDAERAHASELKDLVAAGDLDSVVTLEPGVAPHDVDAIVGEADALVNAMVSGSGDKVVFEAMAAGTLPLVANRAFGSLLSRVPVDLTFDRDDEGMLATRIVALAAADQADLDTARAELRQRVERHHSLGGWAERVSGIAQGLR